MAQVKTRFGRAAALLVLLAFAVRALIPLGYMPAAAGEPFELVICSPSGTHTIALAPDGDTAPAEAAGALDCPFAPVVMAGGLPATALALPVCLLASVQVLPNGTVLAHAAQTGPPLGSRAPPPAA